MIKRYHGTSTNSANSIVGPPANINLTLGGGELGVGFYVGQSVSLCAGRAKSKYGTNTCLIEFKISPSNYYSLRILRIHNRDYVRRLWIRLNRTSNRNTYLFNYDIVRAPYAVIYYSLQEKFESLNAKNILETSRIRII
ncbi:hypothetical protein FEDK69T_30280 [Flavobacterium enshiense DK69]|uniref:PARP catalytic domain-containing protein n=1 Tax=Flavobacterium enshiense DK69 TaxID=1107311 RepID=V6S0M5_9FLAO|nr:hypothetical protein FEDK69T_30280 [Flavobacterium enshiense DK69]KGO91825.1 hypothetical protein Q767_15875 [Flavobacterium enshiense DK69]